MKPADRRNLNPTAPAIVAMNLWGHRYAAQKGGSMDFWDTLRAAEQNRCMEIAEKIQAAPMQERD